MNNFIDYLKKDKIIETFISQEINKQYHKDFLIKIIDDLEQSQNLIHSSSESNNYISKPSPNEMAPQR